MFENYSEPYFRIRSDIGKHINHIKWYNLTNDQISKVSELGAVSTKYLHDDERFKKISDGTYFIINGISTEIQASDDEWFLFTLFKHDWLGEGNWGPILYMCDQFDGLLECVKFVISNS